MKVPIYLTVRQIDVKPNAHILGECNKTVIKTERKWFF